MGQFVKVATAADMESHPGGKIVEAGGQNLALFAVAGAYYAIEDTCPHRGGSLSQGRLEGFEVSCPWHGARFDIRTGASLCPPAPRGVKSCPVRVSNEDIEVEV
jgi:nitrite reductase/ring-hydroxylating ferredoxin subunit